MNKKIVALLLVLVLGLAVFAACKKDEPEESSEEPSSSESSVSVVISEPFSVVSSKEEASKPESSDSSVESSVVESSPSSVVVSVPESSVSVNPIPPIVDTSKPEVSTSTPASTPAASSPASSKPPVSSPASSKPPASTPASKPASKPESSVSVNPIPPIVDTSKPETPAGGGTTIDGEYYPPGAKEPLYEGENLYQGGTPNNGDVKYEDGLRYKWVKEFGGWNRHKGAVYTPMP